MHGGQREANWNTSQPGYTFNPFVYNLSTTYALQRKVSPTIYCLGRWYREFERESLINWWRSALLIQSAVEMQQEGHAAHVKELRTRSKRRYKLKWINSSGDINCSAGNVGVSRGKLGMIFMASRNNRQRHAAQEVCVVHMRRWRKCIIQARGWRFPLHRGCSGA